MSTPADTPLVLFTAGGARCAVPLEAVERVVPALAVTPLPGAPRVVLGVVNLAGTVVPVVELRRKLGSASRDPALSDRLLVVRARRHRVALLVDEVEGVSERGPVAPMASVLPQSRHLEGVAPLPDGVRLIGDLSGFLTLEEDQQLDAALRQEAGA